MSRRIHATAVGLALLFLAALGLAASPPEHLQSPAQAAIRGVLETQQAAWNRGELGVFMKGYWRSDKTEFVGASGVQRGWQAVLDRYRRNYPDRKAMGKLTFSDLEITLLSPDAAYVLGHYELEREADHPEGVFTLILRKFPEGWRIIHDHTSSFPAPSPK
jgi:ketosteroid isomerase-like protein